MSLVRERLLKYESEIIYVIIFYLVVNVMISCKISKMERRLNAAYYNDKSQIVLLFEDNWI